jgi:hypothetical protein
MEKWCVFFQACFCCVVFRNLIYQSCLLQYERQVLVLWYVICLNFGSDQSLYARAFVCVCASVCACVCARACVRVRVRACVCVFRTLEKFILP